MVLRRKKFRENKLWRPLQYPHTVLKFKSTYFEINVVSGLDDNGFKQFCVQQKSDYKF